MFKNRSIQVKVVKDEKMNNPYDQENETFEHRVYAAGAAVKDTMKGCFKTVMAGVITYIVADTIRQVSIEIAKK